MDNLEKQIIDRLNKYFKKYDISIEKIKHDVHNKLWTDIFIYGYGLYTDARGVYFWPTSNDMFFSNTVNIFNVYLYENPNFNKDIEFCKGNSLEEISIKMDLMGI